MAACTAASVARHPAQQPRVPIDWGFAWRTTAVVEGAVSPHISQSARIPSAGHCGSGWSARAAEPKADAAARVLRGCCVREGPRTNALFPSTS